MNTLLNNLLGNNTITVAQCSEIVSENLDVVKGDVASFAIIFLVFFLLLSAMWVYFVLKSGKLSSFIRENKLNAKFQEWKKNDKGLI